MFGKRPWKFKERMFRKVRAVKLTAPAREVLGKNTMSAS